MLLYLFRSRPPKSYIRSLTRLLLFNNTDTESLGTQDIWVNGLSLDTNLTLYHPRVIYKRLIYRKLIT